MGGVVGGALSGASAGSSFGPYGALIGGGIGAFAGGMGDSAQANQQGGVLGAGQLQANYAAQAGQAYNQYANMGNNVVGSMYASGVNNLRAGQNQAVGALSPYNAAGLGALDMYQKSLGMSTIDSKYGGSLGLQQALQQKQNADQYGQVSSLYNIASHFNMPGAIVGNDMGHAITSTATQLMGQDPSTLTPDQLSFIQQYHALGGQSQETGQAFMQPFQQNGQAPTLDSNQQALIDAYNSGNMSGVETPTNANDVISQFENANPQYQFALQQGLQAVQNQNSAKGWMGSAPMAKELSSYASGLASQTYNNWQGQLANLAGMGAQYNPSAIYANTGNNLANLGTNYGSQVNSNLIGQGTNMGNSLLAQGNALGTSQLNSANLGAAQSAGNMGLLGAMGTSGAINPSLFSGLFNNNSSNNSFNIPQPQFDMGFA